MRFARRLLVVVTVIVLVAVVVMVVGLAIATPVVVAVTLLAFALVAGLTTGLSRRSRRQPARGAAELPPGEVPDAPGQPAGDASPPADWVMQWESGPPVRALPFVRDQLIPVLADWGLTGEAGEPTLLVVTELVSNAIDHARAPVRLAVGRRGLSVRVEVHDAAPQPPRPQPHDPFRIRGRGLHLVEALSSRWGWTNDATGKTVWADVTIGWPE